MEYNVLVTIDLSPATDEQRQTFYEVLSNNDWKKIEPLTTTWKTSFNNTASRDVVISAIQKRLELAKDISEVKKVDYALQMDFIEIFIGEIQ